MKLTMEANCLNQNEWFIDGALTVHQDTKSLSGSLMTFDLGMMSVSSNKQKINTLSSNMSNILWTRYFLGAQHYPMKPSIIHQDNQRSMLLDPNRRGSSSKQTPHMNIRYFFVAGCQQHQQVRVTFSSTDEMIDDFFTKPLSGVKFRIFWNITMNCQNDDYGPVDLNNISHSHYQRVKSTAGKPTPTQPLDNDIHTTI